MFSLPGRVLIQISNFIQNQKSTNIKQIVNYEMQDPILEFCLEVIISDEGEIHRLHTGCDKTTGRDETQKQLLVC